MRKRWKRKSGYITPDLTVSKKDLIKHDLFINAFYDDWMDYRDGFRDFLSDFKKIKKIRRYRGKYLCKEVIDKRIKMNLKQKKLLKRRQAKKFMEKLRGSGLKLLRKQTLKPINNPLEKTFFSFNFFRFPVTFFHQSPAFILTNKFSIFHTFFWRSFTR